MQKLWPDWHNDGSQGEKNWESIKTKIRVYCRTAESWKAFKLWAYIKIIWTRDEHKKTAWWALLASLIQRANPNMAFSFVLNYKRQAK